MFYIALVCLIRGDYIHKVSFIVPVGEEGNERKTLMHMWLLSLLFVVLLYSVFFKGNTD